MSNKDLISLSEEVTALRLYLDLEALRFEGMLKYEVSIHESLQHHQYWLPPMLVQPYLENAIKHGLLHSKRPWQLSVFFKQGENAIVIVVDDNGIGRKKSSQINANRYQQHVPFAMSANEKRLQILNRGLKDIISVEIIDKYDKLGMAEGTTVVLHVPTNNHFTNT
jgi:LytS/YehU family sensor histidine kinase